MLGCKLGKDAIPESWRNNLKHKDWLEQQVQKWVYGKKYIIFKISFNFNKYAINISIIVCYKDYTCLRFVWSDFQFALSEANWQKNLTLISVCFCRNDSNNFMHTAQAKKYIYKDEKINICFHYESSETEITIDKIIIKIKSTLFYLI